MKKKLLAVLGVLMVLLVVGSSGCVQAAVPAGWAGFTTYGNKMITVSGGGQLYALSLDPFSTEWVVDIKETASPGLFSSCGSSSTNINIYGTPVVVGDLLYAAGFNGKVYIYNLVTRERVADKVLDEKKRDSIVGGPVVSEGLLFVGSTNGNMYALDASTLESKWKYKTNGKIWSTPVFSNGKLIFGSFDGKVYSLNTDGTLKWDFKTGGAVTATPVVSGGVVYVVAFDGCVYALDEETGSLKWKYPAEAKAEQKPTRWLWATPVLHNGYLYAPCMDGKVYAINVSSPSDVKVLTLDSQIASSPVVSGGKVVVVTASAKVYLLDSSSNTGEQTAVLDLRGTEGSTSMTVTAPLGQSGGKVFIHTMGPDKVVVFDVASGTRVGSIALDASASNSTPSPQPTHTVTVTVTTTVTETVTK